MTKDEIKSKIKNISVENFSELDISIKLNLNNHSSCQFELGKILGLEKHLIQTHPISITLLHNK
jgi:hypothetical protein